MKKSFLSSYYFLTLFGIILIVISVFLWKSQESRTLSQIDTQTESKARTYSSETEIKYKNIYNAINRMANKGTAIDVIESDEWKNDAALYIDSFDGIRSIAWVDKTFRIQWITPLQENESYLNKIANYVVWNASDVNLWVPSYEGLEFRGYILATINIDDLFIPVVSDIGNDYMLQVSNEDGTVFSSENWEHPNEEFRVNRIVTLQNTTVLNLSIAPTNDLIDSEIKNANRTLIISLLFSFIILIAVHFAQRYSEVSKLSGLRFRKTLESMLQGCQIIGSDWRYLFINDTAAIQNQRSKDELIGRTVMECFPGIEETDLFSLMKRCMDDRIPQEMQNQITFPDGSTRWYEMSIESAPDGILLLSNDVTEYKNTNEALQESKEHYRNLFESSMDGNFIIDMKGNYVDANRAALDMVGYSISELRKLKVEDIRAQGKHYPLHAEQQRAWREGATFEIMLKHKNGKTFPVDLSISPIKVGKKQELVLGIARDITQRKRTEKELENYSTKLERMVAERTKELEQAQEELILKERLATLGQLSGSIGHELRNPLGVISNAVYYLEAVLPRDNEKVTEYLGMISSEVKKSSKIIADLLGFARVESTQIESAVVTELVSQILERHPAPQNIKLKLDVADSLPSIKLDIQQVGQILTNLVTNAYQAMPDGGTLDITAKRKKTNLHLSVADTGCGICSENMKNLFKPLFTTKARGIGLGLAISKKLAEAHGGWIEVESEEGVGSTFTLILPIESKVIGQ